MTQEEKPLLLVDLSARLPYCVKCYYEKDGGKSLIHTVTIGLFAEVANREDVICKPYLRPMSSMTEKEKKELEKLCHIDFIYDDIVDFGEFVCEGSPIKIKYIVRLIDYLNSHYLDYRGLIPLGLALEAKEGMYNIK